MPFLDAKPPHSFICLAWGAIFFVIVIVFIDICHLNYDWWGSCATGPKEALLSCLDSTDQISGFTQESGLSILELSYLPRLISVTQWVSALWEILFCIHQYPCLLYIKITSYDFKITFGMDTYSSVLVKLNGRET